MSTARFKRSALAVATIALLSIAMVPVVFVATSVANTKESDITLSLTDGKEVIGPNGNLHYVIGVTEYKDLYTQMNVSLSLPAGVHTVTPDDGGRYIGGKVFWDNVELKQGLRKMLSVSVTLEPTLTENSQLLATAHADGLSVTDSTLVSKKISVSNNYRVSITDGETNVIPGSSLSYVVKVENVMDFAQRNDVVAYAPDLSAIESASAGGVITPQNITWSNVLFAPHEQKTFSFKVTFRNRMPDYTSARASAKVANVLATDTTIIHIQHYGERPVVSSGDSNYPSSNGQSVLFRKSVNSSEVIPGGTLQYTLFVQNLQSTPISNALITDRFDPTKVSFAYGANARQMGNGQLQFTVPTLQPNQVWQTTYVMNVSPSLQANSQVVNIATISGIDINGSLNQKVSIVQTGVISELPVTGAPFDLIFLSLVATFAIASTATQKIGQRII